MSAVDIDRINVFMAVRKAERPARRAAFSLALPLIALAVVAVRRPRLAARREFAPRVVQAGSVTTVTVVASNTAPGRSLPAVWWDRLPWHPWSTPPGALRALEARE